MPRFFHHGKNDLVVTLEAVDKVVAVFDEVCTVLGTEEWMAQTAQGAPTKAIDSNTGGGLQDPKVSCSSRDGGGGVIEGSMDSIISGLTRPARSQQLSRVATCSETCFYAPYGAL